MISRFGSRLSLPLFMILVLLASAGDLSKDLSLGAEHSHIVQEAVTLIAAIIGLGWLIWKHRYQKQEIQRLRTVIEQSADQQPASEEVVKAKKEMAEAIRIQFDSWKLTPSEKEVGLLLLKGFSAKEISLLRETSEKTIRNHSSSIYQKAGVSGRHAFSAWFIEDFL